MGSLVSVCSQRGAYMHAAPGTVHPVDSINKWTTLEKFTAKWSQSPSYGLRYFGKFGYTALHQATQTGNIPMIEYICNRTGGRNLVNLGDVTGVTSLFYAIRFNQRSIARILIHLGADVNMKCPDRQIYKTPLSFAIEHVSILFNTLSEKDIRAQKVAMAKLFLIHKGIAEPKTKEGIEILEEAQKEIVATQATLLKEITEGTPADAQTIKTIMSYVPLDEIPEDVPETHILDWISNDMIKINSYTIQWSQRFNSV